MAPTFEQVYPVLYQGWDPAGARADFNAGGWKNKAGAQQFLNGGGQQMDVNKVIEDSFSKLQAEMVSKYGEYKQNHPFSLDQVLADKAVQAKEQIDPYYNETLSNYLTGVTRKIDRSSSDAQDLLSQLNADTNSYSENTKLRLNDAINRSQEGYADNGMFSSGGRLKDQGVLQTGANADMTDYMRNQDFKQKGINNDLSRTVEDLTSAKTQTTRDLARQQYTDVSQRTSDLTKEAGQQWVTGFKATLPPELQAQSGFNILQDIGINN